MLCLPHASKLLGSRVGRILYTRFNFSPRFLLPALYGDRSKLTPKVHRHYLRAFPDPRSRVAPRKRGEKWTLARELIGSSAWYEALWARRDLLAGKPTLVLWGERDTAFDAADLARWQEALPDAEVRVFSGAGHFVPEEEPEAAASAVAEYLLRVDGEAGSGCGDRVREAR